MIGKFLERRALVALYEETNGPQWTRNDGWMAHISHCNWHGVTCEAGYVAHIDLEFNGLSGHIPEDLKQLTHLKTLKLGHNNLRGRIPDTLGHLRQLEHLDLSSNELKGAIPNRLRLLRELKVLDLHNNQLRGTIPSSLGDLNDLEVLDLSENQLQGDLPSQLGDLPRLRVLNVSKNSLEGALPDSLADLVTMEGLYFKDTELFAPSDEEFQQWMRMLMHVEDSGIIDMRRLPERHPGIMTLVELSAMGIIGTVIGVVTIPLGIGPSILLGLLGSAGAGVIAKQLNDKIKEIPVQRQLPGPTTSLQPLTMGRFHKKLQYQVQSARDNFSPDIVAKVERIEALVSSILPHIPDINSGHHDVYTVRQTILEYMPEALEAYHQLPQDYARTERIQEGKTAHEHLLNQLDVLIQALEDIAERFPQEDAQRLLIHGRFLEDKFHESN